MTRKLSKGDEAYNAVVDAINFLDPQINDLLNERNKLAAAAEAILSIDLFKQHTIVGK